MMTYRSRQDLATTLRGHLIWIAFLVVAIILRALATQ